MKRSTFTSCNKSIKIGYIMWVNHFFKVIKCLLAFIILFKMNRNTNKIYNTDSSQNYHRKLISPNQQRLNSPQQSAKNTKNQEYRATGDGLNFKQKQVEANIKLQKNTSQSSNQTPSVRSNGQKQKSQNGGDGKQSRLHSSRSKQKKDYMTANLSKFNRKKEEKRQSSNTSQKSGGNNAKEEKKPRYIYTFKEELKQNEKVKSEYSTISPVNPSSGGNKSSRIEQKSSKLQAKPEVSYLDSHSESSYLASSRNSSKPLEINVVAYDNQTRGTKSFNNSNEIEQNFRQPIKKILKNEVQAPVIVQTQSSILIPQPPSQKRLQINEATRIQMQISNQFQTKYSQQLMQKLKNERQQFYSKLRALQNQKNQLQESKGHLIEQKYQLQAQVTILSNTNAELEREIQHLQDFAGRSNREVERSNHNNERMFKELEERYNSLLQEYRNKIKQNGDLSEQIRNQNARNQELRNVLRSAEQELKNHKLENDKIKRIQDAKIAQLSQQYDFQIKQMQIRANDKNKKDTNLQESIKQLNRQLQAKNQELKGYLKKIQELQFQLRDKQELSDMYNSKCAEVDHLLHELNQNKEAIYRMTSQNSQSLQRASVQIKDKERQIRQLKNSLSHIKSKDQMHRLASDAKLQFESSQQEQQGSFQQLIKNQSQETNRLRSDLSLKQEQIYRLNVDNDELRQRVRRLQQQGQLNSRTYTMNLNNLRQAKDATQLILKKRIATLEAARLIH